VRSAENGMSAGLRPWRAIVPGEGTAGPGELLWMFGQLAKVLMVEVRGAVMTGGRDGEISESLDPSPWQSQTLSFEGRNR